MSPELHSTGKTITFPVGWEVGAIYRVLDVCDGQAVFERLKDYHISLGLLEARRSLDGRLIIDPINRTCTLDANVVRFTKKEWDLIGALLAHEGRPATYEALLRSAWGPEYINDTQYLRVWVARLRTKIGAQHIELIHSFGYQLVGLEPVETAEVLA